MSIHIRSAIASFFALLFLAFIPLMWKVFIQVQNATVIEVVALSLIFAPFSPRELPPSVMLSPPVFMLGSISSLLYLRLFLADFVCFTLLLTVFGVELLRPGVGLVDTNDEIKACCDHHQADQWYPKVFILILFGHGRIFQVEDKRDYEDQQVGDLVEDRYKVNSFAVVWLIPQLNAKTD